MEEKLNVVLIERTAFETMEARLDDFMRKLGRLLDGCSERRMSEWLTGIEVCETLDISPRTLQTLRETGRIGYTKLGNKCYYRATDVSASLPIVEAQRVWKGGGQ